MSDEELTKFKRGLVRGAFRRLGFSPLSVQMNEICADSLVHPGWASVHSKAVWNELSVADLQIMVDSLKQKNALSLKSDSVVFSSSLVRQSRRASVKRGKPVNYEFASLDEVQALAPVLNAALEILREIWSEQYRLIQNMINHVIFFRAPQEWSSCDTLTFGTVFYNAEFGREPMDLAEGLIHEAGHHALFVKQTFNQLVTNPETLCRSPLRNDPRPVMGLFHAVFVLKRILEFYDRAEAETALRSQISQSRVAQYRMNFIEGATALGTVARFTPIGEDLFSSLI